MPDLVDIQGDIGAVRSLTDIPTLEIIDETAKLLDETTVLVSALADAAATAAVQARGLTVTLVKTEAQQSTDLEAVYGAINDTPHPLPGFALSRRDGDVPMGNRNRSKDCPDSEFLTRVYCISRRASRVNYPDAYSCTPSATPVHWPSTQAAGSALRVGPWITISFHLQ
jgi:hypothetical protein